MVGATGELELRTHLGIREIGAAAWDRVLGPSAPPFLSFAWLDALESTGCVRPERGWAPLHLGIYQGDALVGVAPAYVKGNSEGEFVFDHSWARFAEGRLGVAYYPKLLIGVPFTPATGPRIWGAPGSDLGLVRRAVVTGAAAIAEDLELSSVHVLFSDGAEADALAATGLLRRSGVQYHWANDGYATFEDFLATFTAKRRAQIRRERRALGEQGLAVEIRTGADVTEEAIDAMAAFYRNTVDKFVWGRRYLGREFFRTVAERMPERLHLVMARHLATGRLVAGAFNLLGEDALYGRYWGAIEEIPFLHFNLCYYAGIEAAIARGLARFEPGAGGEHKMPRGFAPTLTHSTHLLRHPELAAVVADFVDHEAAALRAEVLAHAAAAHRPAVAAQ